MVSLRLWTWAAIVAGAFLGALAALWHGSNPTPDVMAATSRPPSQIERSEQSQSDLRPAPAV